MHDPHALGPLADPAQCTEWIDIDGEQPELLHKQLREMLLIRAVEEKIGDMVTARKIVCPCHLAIGQEAIAVGVSRHLRFSDRIFGSHRSHAHFLAMGGSIFELFSEVLGKATGCSKGMGGSMHLYDEKHGFKGSVPIVAGTVSLAAGAALAAYLDVAVRGIGNRDDMDVGVAYFGDGAVEEGSVHESLNLASHFKWPMLFVCENNLFSSHLHIRLRQPADMTARFAQAHHMATEVVDGNDIVAVARATERLLQRARRGEGPGYLEAITYRHRGHVGASDDDDVGLKRTEDLTQWKQRDPISRLTKSLGISADEVAAAAEGIRAEVTKAWQLAEAAPYPEPAALLDMVYAQPRGHQ